VRKSKDLVIHETIQYPFYMYFNIYFKEIFFYLHGIVEIDSIQLKSQCKMVLIVSVG